MKNFKYISILLLVGLILPAFAVNELESNVKVIDENHINVIMDTNIGSTGSLTGDYKIFENISLLNTTLNNETNNSVVIELDRELSLNYKYSLLSIIPIDGQIEFTLTGTTIEEHIIDNPLGGTDGVKGIKIIDPYTIEVIFFNEVYGNEFDFSILKELNIDSIISETGDILNLTLGNNLFLNTNYILMFFYLKDSNSTTINIGEGIYDFNTSMAFIEEEAIEEEAIEEEAIEEEAIEEEAIEEEAIEEESIEEESIEEESIEEESIEEKTEQVLTGSFNLTNVDVIGSNSLNVSFSNNIDSDLDLFDTFKLFEHSESFNLGLDGSRNITLNLSNKLNYDQNYLILLSDGQTGSMTFNIKEGVNLEGLKIYNDDIENNISYVEFIDEHSIKVFLEDNSGLDSSSVLFSKEINIIDSFLVKPNEILLDLKDSLNDNTLYTLSTIHLKNNIGELILPKDSLYDFTTGIILESELINLNSASDTGFDVEEIAMNAVRTPDTGAKEILLLLLSIFLASVFLLYKIRIS